MHIKIVRPTLTDVVAPWFCGDGIFRVRKTFPTDVVPRKYKLEVPTHWHPEIRNYELQRRAGWNNRKESIGNEDTGMGDAPGRRVRCSGKSGLGYMACIPVPWIPSLN